MKKLSVGDLRWDLEKISKATMYRSEDIGAGKQSAGRRVGKNFPSPMEVYNLKTFLYPGRILRERVKGRIWKNKREKIRTIYIKHTTAIRGSSDFIPWRKEEEAEICPTMFQKKI